MGLLTDWLRSPEQIEAERKADLKRPLALPNLAPDLRRDPDGTERWWKPWSWV